MIVIAVFFLQSITSNIYASADNQIARLNEWLNGCSVEEEVRELIGRGANVNSVINGRAPLHLAAWFGLLAIVQELIVQGADVNIRDYLKETPLHWAARKGNVTIAQELIGRGADVNATEMTYDITPLHCAASEGYFEMVRYLLESGANTEKKVKDDTPADSAQQNGYDDIAKYIHDWKDFPEIKGAIEE
jgi:ankyrin repeat protein